MSSITVFIAVKLPVSADLYDHMGGEGIDHGRTNAVETTGYLIYRAVKLAAGMKNGIDNAETNTVFFLSGVTLFSSIVSRKEPICA